MLQRAVHHAFINSGKIAHAHYRNARIGNALGEQIGCRVAGRAHQDMIGGFGDITPDQAAVRIAERIEELNLKTSGTFWHSNGEVLPW